MEKKKLLKYTIIIIFILVITGIFFWLSWDKITVKKQIKIENPESFNISPQDTALKEDVEKKTEDTLETEPIAKESEVIEPEIKEEINKESDEEDSINIKNKFVSWGYSGASGRNIDTVILHSSYNALGGDFYDLEKLIDEYKQYSVSPHYLIDRKGNIYRLVEDKNIAYHAGESKMPDGRTNANTFSIGIEMMNTKVDKFTSSQYDAVNDLIKYLKGKYKIEYILGHSDIASGRKTDPWNIDWNKIEK